MLRSASHRLLEPQAWSSKLDEPSLQSQLALFVGEASVAHSFFALQIWAAKVDMPSADCPPTAVNQIAISANGGQLKSWANAQDMTSPLVLSSRLVGSRFAMASGRRSFVLAKGHGWPCCRRSLQASQGWNLNYLKNLPPIHPRWALLPSNLPGLASAQGPVIFLVLIVSQLA